MTTNDHDKSGHSENEAWPSGRPLGKRTRMEEHEAFSSGAFSSTRVAGGERRGAAGCRHARVEGRQKNCPIVCTPCAMVS